VVRIARRAAPCKGPLASAADAEYRDCSFLGVERKALVRTKAAAPSSRHQCRLTRRSRRGPTAGHQARRAAFVYHLPVGPGVLPLASASPPTLGRIAIGRRSVDSLDPPMGSDTWHRVDRIEPQRQKEPMLNSEVLADILDFLADLEAAEPLFSALSLFQSAEAGIDTYLDRFAAGGDMSATSSNFHTELVNTRQLLPQIASRTFYRALDRVVHAAERFGAKDPERRSRVVDLQGRVEEFSTLFEAYLGQQTAAQAVPVLRKGAQLLLELQTVRATLIGVAGELAAGVQIRESEESISFYFPGEHSPTTIASRLVVIQDIFDTVAVLLFGPAPPQPVRIVRLEYGSLQIELAVVKAVLRIAQPWITALTSFFYRNQTVEGNLKTSPTVAKAAIKQVIDVRSMLHKSGINTESMDQQLEEAGAAMARNVAQLIAGQIRFKVGDREFMHEDSTPPLLHYVEPPAIATEPPRIALPPPKE